jgi:hypothetical protein
MGSELRINNASFTNYRTMVPLPIPGLFIWAFFGSMGSGNNANLIASGPTLIQAGPVTTAANYKTLGLFGTPATYKNPTIGAGGTLNNDGGVLAGGSDYHNLLASIGWSGAGATQTSNDTLITSGGQVTGLTNHTPGAGYTTVTGVVSGPGNSGLIDTSVNRNYVVNGLSLLTGGWTIAVVARVPATGAPSMLFGDRYSVAITGFPVAVTMQHALLRISGGMFATKNITLPSAATNWRFISHTFTGTTSATPNIDTIYDASDNMSVVNGPTAGSIQNGEQFYFGPGPSSGNNAPCDIAFAMMCGGALNQTQLNTVYASVKGVLASRNITVV